MNKEQLTEYLSRNPFFHYESEKQEICSLCNKTSSHKISEELNAFDPSRNRHPFTNYLCCACFTKVMGPGTFCFGGFWKHSAKVNVYGKHQKAFLDSIFGQEWEFRDLTASEVKFFESLDECQDWKKATYRDNAEQAIGIICGHEDTQ